LLINYKLVYLNKLQIKGMKMKMINHINNFQFNENNFLKFIIDSKDIGWIHRDNIIYLKEYVNVFTIKESSVVLNSELNTFKKRTEAVDYVMKKLYEVGIIKKWRDEPFDISESFGQEVLMAVDRGASLFLGIQAYGVFLNGYCYKNNKLHLWVAKRASTKKTYPGSFDNIVAGGLTGGGYTPKEILIKEAKEEAGMSIELSNDAQAVGIISYIKEDNNKSAENAVMFNYDLLLPEDFIPIANDGEVDYFELWDIEKVKTVISSSFDFKDNSNLVIIDFLVRHGILDFQDENFIDIIQGLRK